MPKRTHDYDNVFKTMKVKHKRLFISVINDTFDKQYPLDIEPDVLPSEGFFTEMETKDGSKEIEEQISDFLLRIGGEVYLLECQSYEDGSIAIRIAEYAFLAARQSATWDNGHVAIPMPHFAVIYVRSTDQTPKKTSITFTFPNGESACYESDNILLHNFSKEYIIEKRLFPYIPFYIARYEKDILSGKLESAVADLIYFKNEMIWLYEQGDLTYYEMSDLTEFVNTIITHITDGNKNEERLVSIMGGTILETASERFIRLGREDGIKQGIEQGIEQGQAKNIIEFAREMSWTDDQILNRLLEKLNIPLEKAKEYLKQFDNPSA